MRDVLRGSLGRSLERLPNEDRLAAAWAVACGPALAARAEVLGLDPEGDLHIRILQPAWQEQFAQMRPQLLNDLRRIAGVRLRAIHFERELARPTGPANPGIEAAKGSAGPRRKERGRTR